MGTQIKKSAIFSIGNHVFLLGGKIEERDGKTKFAAFYQLEAEVPSRGDMQLFLWLPTEVVANCSKGTVLFCKDVVLYLKGDRGSLFVEGHTAIIGSRKEQEPNPKVVKDDIHATDFLPEDITNPNVPTWKVPPK